MSKTTHFGFKTVAEEDKAKHVANVFTSVAGKYDVMNDLMSAGLHRLWKRFAIEISGIRTGQRVLDVAGGSADLPTVGSVRARSETPAAIAARCHKK